jgi:hypothetical protein
MDKMTSKQRKEQARATAKYLHVSQLYKPTFVQDGERGSTVQMRPVFVDRNGKAHGKQCNIGRNAFKKFCRANGFNHVQIERGQRGAA